MAALIQRGEGGEPLHRGVPGLEEIVRRRQGPGIALWQVRSVDRTDALQRLRCIHPPATGRDTDEPQVVAATIHRSRDMKGGDAGDVVLRRPSAI